MAEKLTNVFSLRQLISLPIDTVIEADFRAAQSIWRFIEQYGFENGHLRMFDLTYQYLEQGTVKIMTVRIPVLSLIPLPLLQVQRAEFRFGINILGGKEPGKSVAMRAAAPEDEPDDVTLYGMLAPPVATANTGRQSGSGVADDGDIKLQAGRFAADIDVAVSVARSDIPAGILRLLNITEQAVSGISQLKVDIACQPSPLQLRIGSPADNQLTIRLSSGNKDKEVLEDCVVTVKVTENHDKTDAPLFSRAPSVSGGKLIGRPQPDRIRAVLDADKYELTLEFFPKMRGDGYLTVTCGFCEYRACEPVKVIFHIEGDKQND